MSSARWTSLSAAIDYAAPLFDGNGFQGVRRVIDISGDGYNNRGRPVEAARDAAVATGITINGLPIVNDRPNPWGGLPPKDLDRYFADRVIGGPGAFIVVARDYTAFASAILSKLLLEIAGERAAPRRSRRRAEPQTSFSIRSRSSAWLMKIFSRPALSLFEHTEIAQTLEVSRGRLTLHDPGLHQVADPAVRLHEDQVDELARIDFRQLAPDLVGDAFEETPDRPDLGGRRQSGGAHRPQQIQNPLLPCRLRGHLEQQPVIVNLVA